MLKVRFTKGELKRQRDALSQFQRYLPILQLKKQQLQIYILQVKKILEQKQSEAQVLEKRIGIWVGLLADPGVDIARWILPRKIITGTANVAGADLPVFKEAIFPGKDYDLFATPLWIDAAIDELRSCISLQAEIRVTEKQVAILGRELRVTTQRVNLFEKVKIPESTETIRLIRIYLGDRQANAVGISKVAKQKIEAIEEAAFA